VLRRSEFLLVGSWLGRPSGDWAAFFSGLPTGTCLCAGLDRKGIVRVIGLRPGHVEEVVKKLLKEPPA